MQQNISSCLVLLPEIVMHDAFNVILWTSADIYTLSYMTISGGRTEQHVIGLESCLQSVRMHRHSFGILTNQPKTLKSDTPLPPVNRTSEKEHHWVMGGKKKYIEMFSSFTEPFNCHFCCLCVEQNALLQSVWDCIGWHIASVCVQSKCFQNFNSGQSSKHYLLRGIFYSVTVYKFVNSHFNSIFFTVCLLLSLII